MRLLSHGAIRKKLVRPADAGRSANCNVMLQPRIGAQHHARFDNTVRAYDRARADLRTGVNNCCWMNLHITHCASNQIISSPSEPTLSYTTQRQEAFATRLLRALITSA